MLSQLGGAGAFTPEAGAAAIGDAVGAGASEDLQEEPGGVCDVSVQEGGRCDASGWV